MLCWNVCVFLSTGGWWCGCFWKVAVGVGRCVVAWVFHGVLFAVDLWTHCYSVGVEMWLLHDGIMCWMCSVVFKRTCCCQ